MPIMSDAPLASTVTSTPPRLGWAAIATITLIAGLGAVLAFRNLQFRPHFDELWHLAISVGRDSAHMTLPRNQLIESAPSVTLLDDAAPVWQIPTHFSSIVHPPLYWILLRLWRDMFGQSLTVARTFGCTCFVAAVIMLFDAVRRMHSTSTALWAALLLAVSSAQLTVAQQVRNYALEILCITLLVSVIARIETGGISRRRVVALFFAALATLFTHYFALFAVAAVGLYTLLTFRGRARWMSAATLTLAALVFALLWLPGLRSQAAAIEDATYHTPLADIGPTFVSDELVRLCLTPMRLLFEPSPPDAWAPRMSCALFILPWLLVRRRPRMLLWILLMEFIVGAVLVLDLHRSTKTLADVRHVVAAGVGLCVLIPLLVEQANPWIRHAVPAMVAIACLAAMGQTLQPDNIRHNEIGKFAGDPRFRSEPILFYADPQQTWRSDVDYLAASQFSDSFPRPIMRVDRPLDDAVVATLRRWPGAVLVCENWQLDSPELLRYAKVQLLGFDPQFAAVAHITWLAPPSTTAPTMQAVAP